MSTEIAPALLSQSIERVPKLQQGDHLTRAEFERRYNAMPDVNRAELVEGVVYMPSPVSAEEHGEPNFDLIGWLGSYRMQTPGVLGGNNTTLRLDLDNEPQPDAHLRIPEEAGGTAKLVDKFLEGATELVAEVSSSTVSYDLHEKFKAYRRNGVKEYIVWRVHDCAIDWFVLVDGRFDRLPLDPDGLYRSRVFPGLWLDPAAMVQRDMVRVSEVLQIGLATPEHADFVRNLRLPSKS